MSAKTIFPNGNSTFLPALAGFAGTTPVPLNVSTITTNGGGGSTVISNLGAGSLEIGGALTTTSGITIGGDLEFTGGGGNTLLTNLGAGSLQIDGALTTTALITSEGINAGTGDIGTSGNITGELITANNGISCTAGSITATAGSLTTSYGSISLTNADVGGTTFNTQGLTLTRNLTSGRNEFDIIAINPTDATTTLSIYVSSGADISNGSIPALQIGNAGVIITVNLQVAGFLDATGSTGTANQVITAQGNGSWLWANIP